MTGQSVVSPVAVPQTAPRKIGIIAGGGALPRLVAESALADGHDVHIIGVYREASPDIEAFPHDWMKWGQVGHMLGVLRDNACTDVVIIGSVNRPDLKDLRFDLGAIRNLPYLLSILTSGGDDSLLSGIVRFYERHGLSVRGAHEVAPALLSGEGLLAGPRPTDKQMVDISKGMEVVTTLGRLDVGQAAVVGNGYVLAVEAAEGTDEMLKRCGELRQWGRSWAMRKRVGVLCKAVKPGQEKRVDMPTIGPNTVDLVSKAGLAGIAVSAGNVLLVDKEDVFRRAQSAGIFILGVASDVEDV
ncbi:MAG: UDP-2,3-diacylglucosamine diphosphatase LpxI [Planctomycetota bacterium]